MNEREMKQRTKRFALDVIELVSELPTTTVARVIGRQLLRAGTSVGANYRASCRAKSKVDMAHKLTIVEEEADESAYWLELLAESSVVTVDRVASLHREANEFVAMMVASRRTLKGN